jgi:hypothetical protein
MTAKAFDYVTNILSSKQDIWDEDSESVYSQWLTNKALSYHYDTVMLANLVNSFPIEIDNELHYRFLHNLVEKKRRPFNKWQKPEEDELISLIQEAYQCNWKQAVSYLNLLNTDGITKLKELLYKGGRNNAT